jgi:hypothetical protein
VLHIKMLKIVIIQAQQDAPTHDQDRCQVLNAGCISPYFRYLHFRCPSLQVALAISDRQVLNILSSWKNIQNLIR